MARAAMALLGGEDVSGRHVCALVHGVDGLYSDLGAFMSDGLSQGDRGVHLVASRTTHLEQLRRLGVDAPRYTASGQLRVLEWDESYLHGGAFSRQAMVRFLRETLDGGRRERHGRTRLVATMEWAAQGTPWSPELVAYEREADVVLRARRDVVVCVYDLERHSASVVTGVREAHSVSLIGGELRSNRPLSRPSVRDRILAAADEHFHYAGIRATGVDTLIRAAGVAKATFYREFGSKDELIVAWLRGARPRWFDRVRATIESSGMGPTEKIRAVYEEASAWLESDGFRGCAFANAAVEITDASHPAWPVIRNYLDGIERYLVDVLAAAGRDDALVVGPQLAVLLSGAITQGVARQSTAPMLAAREAATRLLER